METKMKLATRLMMFTAVTALSANMAHVAINAQNLADAYLSECYSYVEVKTGLTQTKLEAVKGNRKVEVIYDNATGAVIKQEFEAADSEYIGRTGVEIETSNRDFEGGDDDAEDQDDDGDSDDDNDDDSDSDDDSDDDRDDDDEDDRDDDSDDDRDDDRRDDSGRDDDDRDDDRDSDSDNDRDGKGGSSDD
jgi:hypothetical protein